MEFENNNKILIFDKIILFMKKKAQYGLKDKGVFINSNATNKKVGVRLNNGEIIYVDSIDGRTLDSDSIIPNDSTYVERGFLSNKATTFKPQKQNKIPLKVKKQFGGTGQEVVVEDGEIYQDEFGNIVESNSFDHEDNFILLPDGSIGKAINGNGGELVNAQSVVSDSYEKVKSGDRKNSEREKVLKFTPNQSKDLLKGSGLHWFKTKKSMSPSELIKEAVEQTNKFSTKLGKDVPYDQYGKNSQNSNKSQIPNEEKIYTTIFEEQEERKIKSGLFEDENTQQYGGELRASQERGFLDRVKMKILDTPIGSDFQKRYPTNEDKISALTEGLSWVGGPITKSASILGNVGIDLKNYNTSGGGLGILGNAIKFGSNKYRTGRDIMSKGIGFVTDILNPNERDVEKLGIKVEKNQYGGSTYVAKPSKNPAKFRTEDEIRDSYKEDWVKEAFVKEHYPEVTLNYHDKNTTDYDIYLKDGEEKARAYNSQNNIYVERGSKTDIPAELAHTEQFRNQSMLSAGIKTGKDILKNILNTRGNFDKAQRETYKQNGTFENEAHSIIQPKIEDKLYDYENEIRNSPWERMRLNQKLGTLKKKQFGGIPTSYDGLNAYPEQPVIVPSNQITMEDINYPVEAYDADTLKYLETMQPEQDYYFEGVDNILEIPKSKYGLKKAQSGIDNRNRGKYQQLLKEAQDKYKRYDLQFQNAKSPSEKKLAEINRQEAYDSVQYLSSRTQPDQEYVNKGTSWNPLDRGVRPTDISPITPSRTQNTNVIQYSGNTPTQSATRTSQTPITYEQDIPGVYKIKQGDSLGKIANAYGLTVEDLMKSNPELVDKNRIVAGDTLNIPELTIKGKAPITSWNGLQDFDSAIRKEYKDLNTPAGGYLENVERISEPDVDGYLESVNRNSNLKGVADAIKDNLGDVEIGRLDRTQGTNALRQMMMNNRSVALPYRQEIPNRTLNYAEEDITPYLEEIDASVQQQLQYINPNSTQGQAMLANLTNRADQAKRQTINRVSQTNLQRRSQTDNQNVQMQNQSDLMQEQANKGYVDEVYQTIANQDRNKVQQAEYMDDLINTNSRTNNAFLMSNIKNPNFQIDPVTGAINRIGKAWNSGTTLKSTEAEKAYADLLKKQNNLTIEELEALLKNKKKAKYGLKKKV